MDAVSIAPFPDAIPIAQPLSIIYITSLVIGSLLFYPLFLTHKKPVLLWCAIGCYSFGFVLSWWSDIEWMSVLVCGLVVFQLASIQLLSLPDWIASSLNGIVMSMSVLSLGMVSQDLTASCHGDILQCRVPLFMGTGFLMYGTCVFLNLVSILKLPRMSTPEYYEALVLSIWGLVCLSMSGVSILGSEWKALNLGLLWFTGGLFSISLTVQTWIPVIRERNIVNSLVVCLTGRAIVIGITDKDDYAATIHTLLGHLLIIGSSARFLQIVFRKSPLDNYGLFQTEQQQQQDIKTETCKHITLFASITMLSGFLVAFSGITVGILFMGATHDWLSYMRYYIHDPSLYLNGAVAVAFLWCAYLFVLCTLYKKQHSHRPDYEYHELESAIESVHEVAWEVPEPTEPIMISPLEPTRPSEYRAKRRSLLVQPLVTSNARRSRSSSGVGGILPDESPSKSGGSTGYFSESPVSSPEHIIPFASVSSTYPTTSHHPSERRNSAGPLDYLSLEESKSTSSSGWSKSPPPSYFVSKQS
ncbi:hypothetical protein K501DRAFT_285775 [Backusella circina FSU 941]|nr:hypothetical protein K501DRAFT_285775 [Backusella circina FSU 941]